LSIAVIAQFTSGHHNTLAGLVFQVAVVNCPHGFDSNGILDRIATPKHLLYSQVVRFKFDKRKSVALRSNPKRGIGFEEAQEIFRHPYYLDQREDLREQYRAIGWVSGLLYSVILEIREDKGGEYYHLVTLWKATTEEHKLYEENL
jgi:uncharacterized DUF497 family protein